MNETEVEKARAVLREAGFYVDNLWHVDDVKVNYNVFDNEDAQDILNEAISNEWVFDQIWYAIRNAAEYKGFKQIEDED